MKKAFNIKYEDIISLENLLKAWKEFLDGKTNRDDVLEFQKNLMGNIISLHRALNRFRDFGLKVSQNKTKTCWILKGDVKKCFASVDHEILIKILNDYIQDQNIIEFLEKIIRSFNTKDKIDTGLPLGNLTSQLFINVHLNKFDQFIKHKLKIKYYERYADDFVILSADRDYLLELIPQIAEFLEKELKLLLHPDKLFIKTLSSGLDFLGWIHFTNHRVLRTSTKKKMFRNIKSKEGKQKENAVASYLGMLKWGNGYKLQKQILRA